MYKIIHLVTGEDVIKPLNRHGNPMTIKVARRYLKSDKSYTVRLKGTAGIWFTTEPEFIDTHPNYNADVCNFMGREKVPKHLISIMRIKDA